MLGLELGLNLSTAINPLAQYLHDGELPIYVFDAANGVNTLGVTRTGDAKWVSDASGNLVEIPSDTLAFDYSSGSRMLRMEGASTRINAYPEASVSNWINSSATVTQLSGDYLGVFGGVRVASTGGTWNRLGSTYAPWTSGGNYAVKALVGAGTSGQARITIRDVSSAVETTVSGALGSMAVTSANAGAATVLSQLEVQSGIWEVAISFTPNSTPASSQIGIGPHSATSGEDVIAIAMQLEESSTATSWILNDPSSTNVTRAADLSTVTGLTGLGGGYTFFSDYILGGVAGGFDRIIQMDDGDNNNRQVLFWSNSGMRHSVAVYSGGASQGNYARIGTLGVSAKSAFRVNTNEFQGAINGSLSAVDSSVDYVIPDRLYVAASNAAGGAKPELIDISKILIYPPVSLTGLTG